MENNYSSSLKIIENIINQTGCKIIKVNSISASKCPEDNEEKIKPGKYDLVDISILVPLD